MSTAGSTDGASVSRVGIMQGRLSPRLPGRLQAFPWETWAEEFSSAQACGFDSIEWLLTSERHEQNPLWTADGLASIRSRIDATGVRVRSVCADYFITRPFLRVSQAERRDSVAVLQHVIAQSAALGAQVVLLPALEGNAIQSEAESDALLADLTTALTLARKSGVRIGIEADLSASELAVLMRRAQNETLGVYYDTGNAVACGYDPAADIRALAAYLIGVHIKDRLGDGPNVPLGRGSVDFDAVFDALAAIGYAGPLVLETAVEGDPAAMAARHLRFVESHLERARGVAHR